MGSFKKGSKDKFIVVRNMLIVYNKARKMKPLNIAEECGCSGATVARVLHDNKELHGITKQLEKLKAKQQNTLLLKEQIADILKQTNQSLVCSQIVLLL